MRFIDRRTGDVRGFLPQLVLLAHGSVVLAVERPIGHFRWPRAVPVLSPRRALQR
jgi:hypothetical protein